MDFFQSQQQARRSTLRLVVLFVVAVIGIVAAVYSVFAFIVGQYGHHGAYYHGQESFWKPDLFAEVSVGVLALILMGSIYKMIELSSGGEAVARTLGGRRIPPNTPVLEERVLLNVVEEMAIASGVPVPPVYLLEEESSINAFAAGTTPQNVVIAVTRGTLNNLSRDELQGVIGHEFSHILNGDTRLNLRLIGLLNGILLLAIIGYFLMRTTGFSSSSDEKKGGNPLPFIGVALWIIGYIGVFFGKLIKSAVSRQREFLADASAVQFTRNPPGITGALKKIGGLLAGSKLDAPHAEEASHIFFGNGLAESWFQLLSTHPPLVERIRRIEPEFDGTFPSTRPVVHSGDELVDPQTLARRWTDPAAVQQQLAGAMQAMAVAPAVAVASIGNPSAQHLEYAANLIGSLPAPLAATIRDPLGAVATIYALLLDDDEPDVQKAQIDYLAQHADSRAFFETKRTVPLVAQVQPEARLPLVSMALPALHGLSPNQLSAFRKDVEFLIAADKKMTLFEFAVQRIVLKRLLSRLEGAAAAGVQYRTLESVMPQCVCLLSTLARAGGNPDEAAQAYLVGIKKLVGESAVPPLLPLEQCGLKVLDTALDQLAAAAMDIKKQVLEGCAACIAADGKVTIKEAELLRVIADALDCPMPPLAA